jgi:hypothetical protein
MVKVYLANKKQKKSEELIDSSIKKELWIICLKMILAWLIDILDLV